MTSISKQTDVYLNRLNTYDKDHCWQYDIRLQKEEEDRQFIIDKLNIRTENIDITDFDIIPITLKDKKDEAINFIKRYEWLGTITQFSTHYFGAYYKDVLGGGYHFLDAECIQQIAR